MYLSKFYLSSWIDWVLMPKSMLNRFNVFHPLPQSLFRAFCSPILIAHPQFLSYAAQFSLLGNWWQNLCLTLTSIILKLVWNLGEKFIFQDLQLFCVKEKNLQNMEGIFFVKEIHFGGSGFFIRSSLEQHDEVI